MAEGSHNAAIRLNGSQCYEGSAQAAGAVPGVSACSAAEEACAYASIVYGLRGPYGIEARAHEVGLP